MATKKFSSFDDLITTAETPVLVSFYATWCGYCKSFAPTLDQLKTQLGNRIQVVKINGEKYPQLAARYQVQAFPTTLIFVQGKLVHQIKGAVPLPQLMQAVTQTMK